MVQIVKRLALAATLCVVTVAAALAAEVTVSWTHPVNFSDGTPLAIAQIASTRVERGTCNAGAFGTKQGEQTATGSATSVLFPSLSPGTYCFRAYTKATAAAGGLESIASNVASKVIPFPTPSPPVIVTVTTAVYDLKPNGKLGFVVGTVALGTECGQQITSQGQRKYHELSMADVELTHMPSSILIVGQCEPT